MFLSQSAQLPDGRSYFKLTPQMQINSEQIFILCKDQTTSTNHHWKKGEEIIHRNYDKAHFNA